MPSDLIVWGVGTSRTIRVHWMLAELGLDYETRAIGSRTGETLTPEFLRLNPRHKVPVLQHGPRIITESAAIIQYLGETFDAPEGMFVPRTSGERAQLNEWCYFIGTELDASSLYVVRKHLGLKHIYGEAPVAVESARKYFSENAESMAPRISAAPYLMGDRFSPADILLTTCLEWAAVEKISLSDALNVYRRRMTERPAFRVALQKNAVRSNPA